MPHLRNRTNCVSEIDCADFQGHDRMIIPAFLELSIGTTELSDTFDALIIVSFTWEPDYASGLQVPCPNAWSWVPIV
jgi:hypothetical protein